MPPRNVEADPRLSPLGDYVRQHLEENPSSKSSVAFAQEVPEEEDYEPEEDSEASAVPTTPRGPTVRQLSLGFLQKNPGRTATEVARAVRYGEATVSSELYRMAQEGLLERVRQRSVFNRQAWCYFLARGKKAKRKQRAEGPQAEVRRPSASRYDRICRDLHPTPGPEVDLLWAMVLPGHINVSPER